MKMNKIELYDGKLSFLLPETYEQIPAEEAKNYFSVGQPEYLYMNKNVKSVVTVTGSGQTFRKEQTEERLAQYYNTYRRITPGFKAGKMSKKENGKTFIGAFHYQSTTIDRDMFNLFALTAVKGEEKVLTMHCEVKDSMDEGLQFMKLLSSVTVSE